MVKNTTNIFKIGLVAILVLSFVGIVFYVTKDKRTCAEKNQVDDPSPNKKGGCLNKCISEPDNPKEYRCKTSKCKRQWYKNIEKAVCADCDEGQIPIKDYETGNYNCVPECKPDAKPGASGACNTGEECVALNTTDPNTVYHCISQRYTCTQDPVNPNRGNICIRTEGTGTSLVECLKKGNSGAACTCNHKQGYALNSANTACSTTACTLDGLNGWGSNQDPSRNDPKSTKTNNSNKSYYVDPIIVDESKGTCYAIAENGLLLDPNDDKSKTCSSKTTAEQCHDTNSDGWKCKWLPGVKCTRKKYDDTKCQCLSRCFDAFPQSGVLYKYGDSGKYIDACPDERCIIDGKSQPDCAGFQYACMEWRGEGPYCVDNSQRDVYSIPPTNCLTKKGFVLPSDDLIRYGDDIILSIDNNKLFNQSRLLYSCGLCSSFDSSATANELMTFVGIYGGESSPVRTDTITFKIVPTFSPKDNQKAADDLMGKVLKTNDAFHLRAKYGDSKPNQASYYYLTEAKCTPKIYSKYTGSSSTFQKTGAKGYTSLSQASSKSDQTVPTATFRFVDLVEDDKCTPTAACNQDSTPVTSKKAYRLKFAESSTYPYYVGLGDNPLSFGNNSNRQLQGCKANFLVTYGPKSKTNWFIMKPQSIIQAQCPHFFNNDGSPKTNEQIGGYNPAT
jgi:hypothetical protein